MSRVATATGLLGCSHLPLRKTIFSEEGRSSLTASEAEVKTLARIPEREYGPAEPPASGSRFDLP